MDSLFFRSCGIGKTILSDTLTLQSVTSIGDPAHFFLPLQPPPPKTKNVTTCCVSLARESEALTSARMQVIQRPASFSRKTKKMKRLKTEVLLGKWLFVLVAGRKALGVGGQGFPQVCMCVSLRKTLWRFPDWLAYVLLLQRVSVWWVTASACTGTGPAKPSLCQMFPKTTGWQI